MSGLKLSRTSAKASYRSTTRNVSRGKRIFAYLLSGAIVHQAHAKREARGRRGGFRAIQPFGSDSWFDPVARDRGRSYSCPSRSRRSRSRSPSQKAALSGDRSSVGRVHLVASRKADLGRERHVARGHGSQDLADLANLGHGVEVIGPPGAR